VCRSPTDFLDDPLARDAPGALRLGVDDGAYCLGCWTLMAVLVVAAAMALASAAVIALAVFAKTVLPAERFWRFAIAATLAALAVATVG
jgi:predicted metal-binding membrane protein